MVEETLNSDEQRLGGDPKIVQKAVSVEELGQMLTRFSQDKRKKKNR